MVRQNPCPKNKPCSQPPGDSGSRGNLKDKRKATVANVARGMMGIVNIYQLVPKGMTPAPPQTFGIPPAPPGAPILPQTPPSKQKIVPKRLTRIEKKVQREAEREMSVKYDDVGWVENSHARNDRLAAKKGNIIGPFLIRTDDYGPEATVLYENTLNQHPHLITPDNQINERKFKNAIKQLQLLENKGVKFQQMLSRQAMNLKIRPTRMKELYDAAIRLQEKERQQAEEKAKLVPVMPQTKAIPKARAPTLQELSYISPDNVGLLKEISLDDARNPSRGYQMITDRNRIAGLLESKETASRLKYSRNNSGDYNYYVDVNSLRRRKHSKVKIKRKPTQSSARKKLILNKLKCKCRRKRR